MAFFLVRLEPDPNGGDKMLDVPIPDYGPYEKGPEAAKAAKDLTAVLGYKIQPRRIHQAPDWRARQQDRLARGVLVALPELWSVLDPITDHFAHLAADQARVAFTENDELGTIDRVTPLNPGRYLTRFYPEVDDDLRRRLIASIDPSGEIRFAFEAEQMERIYKEGPSSCMDGSSDKLKTFADLPCWPSAPYAAGDLAVAYTVNNRDRVQSRCIAWPDKKIFGRVFGDHARMIPAMEAEGYTYLRDNNAVDGNSSSRCFHGAKLAKIPLEHQPGSFVMPYFDDLKFAVDVGDHFVSSNEKPIGAPGVQYCATGSTKGRSEAWRWCPKMKDFYPCSSFKMVMGVDEEWSENALGLFAFTCAGNSQKWPKEERVYVQVQSREQHWSKTHFEEYGETCQHSKKNYPRYDIVTLSDGMRVFRNLKVTIDGNDVLHDRRSSYSGFDLGGRNSFSKSEFKIQDYVNSSWRDVADVPSSVFDTYDRESRMYASDMMISIDRHDTTIGEVVQHQRDIARIQQMQERMSQEIELAIVGDSRTRRYRIG